MKILVTGAAGFFGSNLCEYLLSKGYEVVGIDNFNEYYNPKFKEYNLRDYKDQKSFSMYKEDILNKDKLDEIFTSHDFDGVVHLAAWAGVTKSIELPQVYIRNNIEGTSNVADMCVKHNVNNFIFASTSSVYGNNQTPFTEDMPTDAPLSPYPATKKACEVLLKTYQINHGLNVSIFRIFNPIGYKLRPDLLLTKAIRSCLYGEELPIFWSEKEAYELTGRDYTWISHIQDSVNHVLNNPFEYEIFNMGNSSPVMLGEMLDTIQEVVGKKANIVYKDHRQGEMLVTYANVDKAKKMIGYNPSTSIKESIKMYYEWFLEQEDWYKKGEF